MTHLHRLSDRDAELLSGGLDNPSQVYCGDNWGQFKKAEPELAAILGNPSQIYCGDLNYGQAKK